MGMLERWTRWLAAAESGLRLSEEGCLWCGSTRARNGVAGGGGARAPGLCPDCAARVPWIDRVRCETCGRAEVCPDCPRRAVSYLVANRSAVAYSPFMKDLLARYKYRGSEKLSPLIGEMACYAYKQLSALWPSKERCSLLTFVPLSERRLEERGFNQAEVMARFVGRRFRVPVAPLLVRTRHTEKQSYKSRRERLESLERAFALRPDAEASLRRYAAGGPVRLVIVDDVYTTGSTLQHCAWTIAESEEDNALHSLRIYGLTWAR